jgi:N-acetylneuraminic acid mutarotase
MRHPSLLFFLLAFSSGLFAQNYQWTWVSGDSSVNQLSTYGTKGTPAAGNTPGSRGGAASWSDAWGNFWLFGGYASSSGYMNDMWKYVPSANHWTWLSGDSTRSPGGVYGIKGQADSVNKPGGRVGAVTWTDSSGNFWLFGGRTEIPNKIVAFNDLWKYSPATGWWTWINGDSSFSQAGFYGTKGIPTANNKPGARYMGVTWTDMAGNFWLFGGWRISKNPPFGLLNDLWKYDPLSNQWTWLSGDSTINVSGVYGTKGIAASINTPGSRSGSVSWMDKSGNLWLMGGNAFPVYVLGNQNDLWKYSPSTGLWTWMGGDTDKIIEGTSSRPSYGIKGVPAPANRPGGRSGGSSWTDTAGHFWLFGGYGASDRQDGQLNDLWKYVPETGLWTWVGGENVHSRAGIYGSKGIASPANAPGSRQGHSSWIDAFGSLWLFGGSGYGKSITRDGPLNDLWKYSLAAEAPLPVQFTSFTARKNLQTVLLNWRTAQEQNSMHFVIERSLGGSVYDSIGKVAAAGTNPTVTDYSFIDRSPARGTNYYRLKQFDKDGRFMYSAVAKIMVQEDAVGFTIFQNLLQNTLQLNVQLPSSQKLTMQVRDVSGHLLFTKEAMGQKGSSVHVLSIGHLASGTYLLHLQTDHTSSAKTFIRH